jgi:hypothetical protein
VFPAAWSLLARLFQRALRNRIQRTLVRARYIFLRTRTVPHSDTTDVQEVEYRGHKHPVRSEHDILNAWDQFSTNCLKQLRRGTVLAIRKLHVFHSPTCPAIRFFNGPRNQTEQRYLLYQAYQQRWGTICSLLQRFETTSLVLTFESFPANLYTLNRILAPLSAMRVQHLRLSLGVHLPLGDKLTSMASFSATNPPELSFPFEELLYELQMHVLSFTGFVIMSLHHSKEKPEILRIRLEERPRSLFNGCCGTGNSVNFAHCLCHSNYRHTFSSTCTCNILADNLFRVSRTFPELAFGTFYGMHQFYVTGIPEKML